MAAMQRQAIGAASQAPITVVDDAEDDNGAQSDVFANYTCSSIDFGNDHPGDIAEAAGLALIPLPQATYPLQESIPSSVIDTGKLSKLQLEGVLYACQRHQSFLPNGERCGFFIGDGAGVGKGRQIGGIILDNWARGRLQHVWFSISRDLREDAQRDLNDLGLHLKVIDGGQELDAENRAFGLSSEFKEGVLFTTYSTLIGTARNGKMSRLDQIVSWCGGKDVERRKVMETDKFGVKIQKEKLFAPQFSGVLVFDECHRAKNFTIVKEGEDSSSDKSSQTAKCVIEIQQRLPKARIVYCSATGVTELSNLAYCERLGLWGKGLPFPNFEKFHTNASKRGVFFLEMLAMELKRNGSYVSRGLSFAQAEFDTMYYELTKSQRLEYDAAAAFWVKVRVVLQEAISLTGAPKRIYSAYWGAHQRFFRQLILSFKVDFVVEKALQCLENDQAVVIGLQTTGEAALTRIIDRSGGSLSSFVSTTRETIVGFLEQHWPVKVQQSSKGDAEDSTSAPGNLPSSQSDSLPATPSLGPVGSLVTKSLELKNGLLQQAQALELPISALDNLIDKLGGPSKVAEMTGRKVRLVRNAQGVVHVQQRGAMEDEVDQVNIKECSRFMKGSKLVAIISDAASTGISLHASEECQNRRRRVHFTVELPWSADKAVQQLGRSHRSNQASAPIYQLVVTDLGGERRFAAAVSKRLQSLGALTKGDRRAAAGQDLQEFDLDNQYGKQSLKRVLEAIDTGTSLAPGASAKDLQNLLPEIVSGCGELMNDADGMNETAISRLNKYFLNALDTIGCGSTRKDNDSTDVKKFLGRLLGLSVSAQNALFHYFFSVLGFSISSAIKEGRYTDAIADLFGSDSVVERKRVEIVYTDQVTGATCSVQTLRVDRGLSWPDALAKFESYTKQGPTSQQTVDGKEQVGEGIGDRKDDAVVDPQQAEGDLEPKGDQEQAEVDLDDVEEDEDDSEEAMTDLSGFYETRNFVPGRGSKGWLLALQSIDRPNLFMVGRPNTGMLRFEMDEDELKQKYVKQNLEQAERGWSKLYEDSVSFDSGPRIMTIHLLTGTLVPLWEQIEQVVRSFAFRKDSGISKKDIEMKVVRVKVDGQYSVGLKFSSDVIDGLRKQFKLYSLIQSGQAIQITPPHITPATFAQLSGQEILVPVQMIGTSGVKRSEGIAMPCLSDPSCFRLRLTDTGEGNLPADAIFKFGSTSPHTILLKSAKGADDGQRSMQILVEAVDPIDAKALAKALTAKPTMKSFFAAVPKGQGGSAPATSEISADTSESACKKLKVETVVPKPLGVSKGNHKATDRRASNQTKSPVAARPNIFAMAKTLGSKADTAGGGANVAAVVSGVETSPVMDLTGDD